MLGCSSNAAGHISKVYKKTAFPNLQVDGSGEAKTSGDSLGSGKKNVRDEKKKGMMIDDYQMCCKSDKAEPYA